MSTCYQATGVWNESVGNSYNVSHSRTLQQVTINSHTQSIWKRYKTLRPQTYLMMWTLTHLKMCQNAINKVCSCINFLLGFVFSFRSKYRSFRESETVGLFMWSELNTDPSGLIILRSEGNSIALLRTQRVCFCSKSQIILIQIQVNTNDSFGIWMQRW